MGKIILHPERNCKFDKPKFRLRFTAQGSLFTCKIDSGLRRQQKRSAASDRMKEIDRELAARREIWRMSVQPPLLVDPIIERIAYDPDPHLVSLVKQRQLLIEKNRTIKRGVVSEFSRKSRLRLLRRAATLKKNLSGLFITLTYRQNMTDAKEAKRHLELMLLWLKRTYPTNAVIWRMEFQERGAIHFHLIVLNRNFIPAQDITDHWQKVTQDDSYPEVQKLRSRRGVMRYISKYLAKVTQSDSSVADWVTDESADTGFNYKPYSDNYTGRYWGIYNRKQLPLAPEREIVLSDETGNVIFEMRRYARRYYKRLNRRIQGFSLFTDYPERWLTLLYSVLLE